MKKMIVALTVFSLGAGVSAFAGTITLNTAELQSFSLTSGTNVDFAQANPIPAGVRMTSNFSGTQAAAVTGSMATFGTNVVKNWVAGTFFALSLINQDENAWEFELLLNGLVAASQVLAVGQTVHFNVDIGAVLGGASGTITTVGVRVSPPDPLNTTPLIGSTGDDQAEFSVVPEPTSILLLGLGLLATGVVLHRWG